MIRIREATLKDAEVASRIVCLCYEGFGETDNFHDSVIAELKRCRGSAEHIAELVVDENFFVACDEHLLKGMISIKDSEITKLYVDPNHQKQGIGRQLFAHAEAFIQAHGYESMIVGTVTRAAVPFYERMGMKIIETRTVGQGPCSGMVLAILEKVFDG